MEGGGTEEGPCVGRGVSGWGRRRGGDTYDIDDEVVSISWG